MRICLRGDERLFRIVKLFDLNHTVIIPQDHKVLCTEKDNTLAGSFVLLKVRETSDYPYRDACAGGSHTDSATLNLWDLFKKAGVIGTISIDLKNAEPGIFYKQMKYAFHNSEIPLVQLSCDYPHHISDAEIQDVWLSPGEVRVQGQTSQNRWIALYDADGYAALHRWIVPGGYFLTACFAIVMMLPILTAMAASDHSFRSNNRNRVALCLLLTQASVCTTLAIVKFRLSLFSRGWLSFFVGRFFVPNLLGTGTGATLLAGIFYYDRKSRLLSAIESFGSADKAPPFFLRFKRELLFSVGGCMLADIILGLAIANFWPQLCRGRSLPVASWSPLNLSGCFLFTCTNL